LRWETKLGASLPLRHCTLASRNVSRKRSPTVIAAAGPAGLGKVGSLLGNTR
jgi:hypothetical protein